MSKLYIIMYHYTRDLQHSRYPGIKGMDTEVFEKQLNFIQNNFSVVNMEDVIDALNGMKKLPERSVLLTFDDGYIDNFTVAFPLLKKYHMQGSFFIPGKAFHEHVLLDVNKIHFILASAPVEKIKNDLFALLDQYREDYSDLQSNTQLYNKYAIANRFDTADVIFIKRILQTVLPEQLRSELASILFEKYVGVSEYDFSYELYLNRDQIRCMREDGMFIGLHGYDHYWLGNISQEKMKLDIDKALDVMSEFIDQGKWVMNYPYGNSNENVIEYCRSKGCQVGLTAEARIADLKSDNRFLLPRLDCNDMPPKSTNYIEMELK